MVGDTLFFAANDGVHGTELWKSDGTEAGTVLVKDINPGVTSYGYAFGSNPFRLTAVGGTLFFRANDGEHGTSCGRATAPPTGPSWSRTSTPAAPAPTSKT